MVACIGMREPKYKMPRKQIQPKYTLIQQNYLNVKNQILRDILKHSWPTVFQII